MSKQAYIVLYLIITLLFANCKDSEDSSYTYFGGKIINPKSDKIVLFSKEEPIDTFYLDNNHKFFGELKNIEEGLYYFTHGNENQYIYLEPKDSLLIRLNTWDFDESLVFAGQGGDRNNILIDCFLETEKDDKLFYKYYKLAPETFQKKVDSIKKIKVYTLNSYLKNHPKETKDFAKILEVALTYPLFARIEKYPLAHSNYTETNLFPKLNNEFYNFRSNVKFNENSLMYYPPYSYYIRNYLYNKTYSLGHEPAKTRYTSEFTTDLLSTINKELTSEETKNAFLKQTVIVHFYNKSSCNINKEPFEKYFELTTNSNDKEQIQNLLNDTKAVHANKIIQDFEITDYGNAKHSIKDVIRDKNVLLFFWNPDNVSEWYIKSRMEYLQNKYENIEFVQIKMNGDLRTSIKNLDIKNQFYIDSNSKAHSFLTSKMPRSILINKKGKVVNGYASISSRNLKPHLEKLNGY